MKRVRIGGFGSSFVAPYRQLLRSSVGRYILAVVTLIVAAIVVFK